MPQQAVPWCERVGGASNLVKLFLVEAKLNGAKGEPLYVNRIGLRGFHKPRPDQLVPNAAGGGW